MCGSIEGGVGVFLLRYIRYGLQFNYHVRKQHVFTKQHPTVLRYHCEMAKYYHDKMIGE